jgi:hypothetical protein
MNLYEHVRWRMERECRKHELAPDAEQYATDIINRMTPNELLQAISDALEDMGQGT